MTLEQITTLSNDWQGVYYPVPQTLSDSDSEKETINKQDVNSKSTPEATNKSNTNRKKFTKHKIIPKDKKMSGKRKCLFIFSVLLCFLTPVIFVWVLPCPEMSSCPLKVLNWEKQLEGIELFGGINIIKSAFRHSHDLAVLYRGDMQLPTQRYGVFAFSGYNGEPSWHFQKTNAYKLDCSLIDVNEDKVKDCLLLSDTGLDVMDAVTGFLIWHVNKNQFQNEATFELDDPVVMKDLNGDGVDEILISSSDNSRSVLIVISGKTGDILGEIAIGMCRKGHIVLSKKLNIVYSCLKDGKPVQYYNVTDLILKNKLLGSNKSILLNKINFFQSTNKLEYLVNGHVLEFKNEGVCPTSCHVSISLIDKVSNKEVAAFSYPNSYVMEPVIFSFKLSQSNLSLFKGHVSGFVLKLWQWLDNDPSIKDVKNLYVANKNSSDLIEVNYIEERIMIITLNDTNLHATNASLTEIVQLCFSVKNVSVICQPNVTMQGHSLLIEDLDFDGLKELVSYSSSFVHGNRPESKHGWKLVSNIKVVRLESELPKLYKSKK